ncbi:hypothetical protein HR060_09115 [Catenovulum sp. SM1970]|uniref:hypothetical protein n=1 Tax=Marinifaba aquimaris TaxID=2741323 RepID=UPI0015719B18|nr:hypothetical protein [Marinifaba aquimaris]NTS77031.1 hypothetical protein [Marinifaba aquimaris]
MEQSTNRPSPIGTLYLEGLMSRAEILFNAGYQFKGTIDAEQLEQSFLAIVDNIAKFNHQLNYRDQDSFSWQHQPQYQQRFHHIQADDLDSAFSDLSANAFEIRESSNNYPFNLVLISGNDEFIIALLNSHEFVDARSSANVFDLIVKHYNAVKAGDDKLAHTAELSAKSLKTDSAAAISRQLKNADYNTENNLNRLQNLAVADDGGYGVSVHEMDALLPPFKARYRKPVNCQFDLTRAISACRKQYPEVSKNAIINALIHQAIYNLNQTNDKGAKEQTIAGKMVVDIIPNDDRHNHVGNYIGFVPLSTDGHISLADIAKSINDYIVEVKETQLNLTCFDLVEDLAQQKVIGTANEPFSYIITNWNNYNFLQGKDYLHGCESVAHISGVNVDPIDATGAALINRPVFVVNMSFDDQVYISLFPSLVDDKINQQLVDEIMNIQSTL